MTEAETMVREELSPLGYQVRAEVWNDWVPSSDDKIAVIRTTWDYHKNLPTFLTQLKKFEAAGVRLFNSTQIVEWNSNKKYLFDLEQKGVSIIPTVKYLFGIDDLTEKVNALTAHAKTHGFGGEKIIFKPSISASAHRTLVTTANNISEDLKKFSFSHGEMLLLQPFLSEVLDEGEWSLFFFNGTYAYTARKVPKKGDFRVQPEYGSEVHIEDAPRNLIEQGDVILQQLLRVHNLKTPLLYARIDGIVRNHKFWLMELELIEPGLFIQGKTERARRFAKALISAISTY